MTIRPEQFMQRAIELARQGQGRTAPNPPVGAVIVQDDKIVGEGFHPAAGQPHAEIFALEQAGPAARGATLYVTLEPCCHQGRTGPCTEAILAAGIRQVFVAVQDPNAQVAGRGIQQLREAGVMVSCGLGATESTRLIAPFAKHITTGLPYLIYKAAMTLDGRTATTGGDSQWISGPASRRLVHHLRNRVDGVMVGPATVNTDDPRLTTRLDEGGGRDAVRIVIDAQLSTSPDAKVYQLSSTAPTLLLTAADQPDQSLSRYRDQGAEVLRVARLGNGLDLHAAMRALGQRNLQFLLCEGGGTLAAALLRAQLIDRVMLFMAPKLLGGDGRGLFSGPGVDRIDQAIAIEGLQVSQIDQDFLIEGDVRYVHRID
ncbi:MAG: bifunctional diaminohydroxyphosphoribosylaminopyrimidine deaminase/5-amino-6-(5-phosphoribosylamino)uracil reductase RibD [Desulfuromonadales bacterium]